MAVITDAVTICIDIDAISRMIVSGKCVAVVTDAITICIGIDAICCMGIRTICLTSIADPVSIFICIYAVYGMITVNAGIVGIGRSIAGSCKCRTDTCCT